jgi:ArsR family transcriptional regulator, arsenate/arsenite/antimonite-responsive transcriptional repressor
MAKYRNIIDEFTGLTKALADGQRVRALRYLCEGEMCLCQLIEMLGLAPSTVSKHMSILHQAGLVESRKEGRWMYYRLAESQGDAKLAGTIRWLREYLEAEPMGEELKRLREIRQRKRESLCSHYQR